jgi:drug/metabolite transporter (DMT)-like permease
VWSTCTAAVFLAGSTLAQQVGAYTTTATHLGFLINMSAIFVPLLMWLLVGEKPALVVWPVSLMAVIGAFLVTGGGGGRVTLGDALCLLAGLFDAVWIIALGYAVRRCPAPATLTFAMFFVTTLLGLAGSVTEDFTPQQMVDALPEVVWLGAGVSAAGFLLSTTAQQALCSCTIAVICTFEALFSALFGRIFLGEMLDLEGWVGACLIVVSVLILQVKLRPDQKRGRAVAAA